MTVGPARQRGDHRAGRELPDRGDCAYVTGRGHALYDFGLNLPRAWCKDTRRRRRARVPEETTFTTKTGLGTQMDTAAIGAGAQFAWLAGDEVYGPGCHSCSFLYASRICCLPLDALIKV
jgi:hypothetical protein